MKTKIFISAFLAFVLSACCDDRSPEAKAKAKGLECINGWVFQSHTEYPLFGGWKTTYIPLNVECPNGKVVVQ